MKVGRGLFLMVLILGAAGPLYLLLKVSVSPPSEVMTPHPLLLRTLLRDTALQTRAA